MNPALTGYDPAEPPKVMTTGYILCSFSSPAELASD